MKSYITIMLCAVLLLSTGAYGAVDIKAPIKKVVDTSWLKDTGLKYGLLTSFCIAKATSGLTESHKFNGNYIVSDDDYHVYRTAQDISWIGTGWFMYANIQNKNMGWWHKTRRITGSMLLARNAFEWSYKANRWGNPFDYDPSHTNNQKAIVYIKFSNGKLVDAYIGSGKISGPIIDILFLATGIWLFK